MRQHANTGVMAGAWGLASGLFGSLCCIGPSAAVLLGLGSSSALLGFSLDHTLALAGGAALLLGGVLLAVRQTRACDLRPAVGWRAPALMLISFALAFGFLGVLAPALAARQEDAVTDAELAASHPHALSLPQAPAVAAAPQRRLTLSVEKMNCPPCAAAIRNAIKRQPTVRAFVADAYNDQVTIDYDSGRTSAKKLAALIPAHYGVTLISDELIP
ncbi:MAG: heavy-metal-associated domain-containing protein [Roseiflexaceae bacterium]